MTDLRSSHTLAGLLYSTLLYIYTYLYIFLGEFFKFIQEQSKRSDFQFYILCIAISIHHKYILSQVPTYYLLCSDYTMVYVLIIIACILTQQQAAAYISLPKLWCSRYGILLMAMHDLEFVCCDCSFPMKMKQFPIMNDFLPRLVAYVLM